MALGLWALLLGGAPLVVAGPGLAGEIKATGGALGLGTTVNGQLGGSCVSGGCQVGGGTGAGSNLFHRFSAFDTRGAITGVNLNNGSYRNVFVGVTNPMGSFIDKVVSLSSAGNLFWLSPGGIAISGAGSFQNVQQLNLSTATGWKVGSGVFDVAGTTAGQAALLTGTPVTGLAGAVTEASSLASLGLQKNGDLSLSGGLLTVDVGLLLDAHGGNVLLQAAGIQAPGGSVEVQGTTVNLGATRVAVGSATGAGGSIAISGGTVLQTAALSAQGSSGGSVTITATNLLSAAPITATGSQGSGGSVRLEISRNSVSSVDAVIDASGRSGGGSIAALNGGDLFSSGRYRAMGTGAGATGGRIELLAPTISLAAAQLDASGSGGGGRIDVGGGFQGAALVPDRANAREVVVNASTTLKADAMQAGSGGQVVVWSDERTRFGGEVSARGGALGGDGGLLEVSSKGDLTFAGRADASAPAGKAGTLWLDPKNIYIENTTIGGYAYDAQPIALPLADLQGPTTLVEQLGSDLTSPILVNVPQGGLASPQGVVYLFDGTTYGLLSYLYGTGEVSSQKANYSASNNLLALISPGWANGATANAGAATSVRFTTNPSPLPGSPATTAQLADGTSSGVLSPVNSLVGRTAGDFDQATTRFLHNGNALVFTPRWDNGATVDAGALSWISSTTGNLSDDASGGAIGASNSLLNTASASYLQDPSDRFTRSYVPDTVREFSGGNLLVYSGQWNGSRGALTWMNGLSGKLADGKSGGAIASANSLVGSTPGDLLPSQYGQSDTAQPERFFGESLIYEQTNSALPAVALLRNTYWDNPVGGATDAGALTWINVSTGKLGNSKAAAGAIGPANSLVGASANDRVGNSYEQLGNYYSSRDYYLFVNPNWDNPTTRGVNAGAVTWLRGSTGRLATGAPIIGTVGGSVGGSMGTANSLVGSSTNDRIGQSYRRLFPSNYYYSSTIDNLLLTSSGWSDAAASAAGALTWINGSSGLLSDGTTAAVGAVGASNSLVGSVMGDGVGSDDTIHLLGYSYNADTRPNVLLLNPSWNGAQGAITWLSGTTGKLADGGDPFGPIGSANSLIGSVAGDKVGSALTRLTNSNTQPYNVLISSPDWASRAGAVTWLSGATGKLATGSDPFGAVGPTNSLVGSSPGDRVGYTTDGTDSLVSRITLTQQGNVLLRSPLWDNGPAAADAGAVTWIKGATGALASGANAVGAIEAANSLVGTHAGDGIGAAITEVGNYNDTHYVLSSPNWNGGAGAVTWWNMATGKLADDSNPFGAIGAANSLVGSTPGDRIGADVRTTGNFYYSPGANLLLLSPSWSNGLATGAGAVTWINGVTGKLAKDPQVTNPPAAIGVIGAANSLVGSSANDALGNSNLDRYYAYNYSTGGYSDTWLLRSTAWSSLRGAVTWIDANTGLLANLAPARGEVGSANSLVGSTAGDRVGQNLQNYGSVSLLGSPAWDNRSAMDAGAITWINRVNGKLANELPSRPAPAIGLISATNSLVGSTSDDQLGIFAINEFTGPGGTCAAGTTCRNQTYLSTFDRGNSVLIGSPHWNTAANVNAGAVTSVQLSSGTFLGSANAAVGPLSNSNSLVGTSTNEQLGLLSRSDQQANGSLIEENNVFELATGSAVVASPRWSSGSTPGVGAVALISASTGRTGSLNVRNALVGSHTGDFDGFSAQNLGSNALLFTPGWDNGSVSDAGAATWINGSTGALANGASGAVIGSATSLLGSSQGDFAGAYLDANLSGNGLVITPSWDNGSMADAGAATWINGSTGALANGDSGVVIGSTTSLLGSSSGDFLGSQVGLSQAAGFLKLPAWSNGTAAPGAGALAWIDKRTGKLADGRIGGVVGPTNALLGSQAGDLSSVEFLQLNGTPENVLVKASRWANGPAPDAGAFTWINPTTGQLADGSTGGFVGPSNSIVGGSSGDLADSYLRELSSAADRNVLVVTPRWDGLGRPDAGAITWLNSSNGKLSDGTSGGLIGPANSILGTGQASLTGYYDTIDTTSPYRESSSGNVIILSSGWNDGSGALTWLNGKTGALANGLSGGTIGAANSIVGSKPGDLSPQWGYSSYSTAANYFAFNVNASGEGLLFRNGYWNNQAGAVTWLNTSTGKLGDGNPALGVIGAANSLVGSTAFDRLGFNADPYGSNLVLFTSGWDNGLNANAGSVTWLNTATGKAANGTNLIGALGAANSLVGSAANDFYGSDYRNYSNNLIIFAGGWDNGAAVDAGAVTWLNPATGSLADGSVAIGAVGPANSLVGSTAGDGIGGVRRDLLSSLGSNVALISSGWDNGAAADAGAVTWIGGSNGLLANGNPALGLISAANSLVGSSTGDRIGANALEVGYYYSQTGTNLLVLSGSWNNGPLVDAGAVTWISGLTGQLLDGNAAIGPVSANFSIVGGSAGDAVGGTYAPIGNLYSGTGLNVLLQSPDWDALTPGGPIVDAGAVTFVSGQNGLMVNEIGKGLLSSKNSLIGNTAGDRIGASIDVVSPDTFYVNGPGFSPVALPTANVVAQRVKIVPEPLYPLAAPGINFADAGDASITISPSQIQAITNTGTSLVLQASNDILLRPLSNISINNSAGNGGNLTFQAGRSITLNSSITTDNGNLTLIANDPAADPSLRDPGNASIVQRAGTSINAGTGTVGIRLLPTSSALQTAGTASLANVTAGAIDGSAPSFTLSRATLAANGAVESPVGSLQLTASERLSISGSTLTAGSATGAGGTIALDGTSLVIGGSTLNAAGTGTGAGGTIRIGAASTPALPTSVSISSSLLDARGGTDLSQAQSNGGEISIDGGVISLAGASLNTSGLDTGGSISIGTSSTNNPSSVSIVNSSLIADPPATGGFISIGGTTLFTSGSLFNVVGTSGGQLQLGNALTSSLIFGSGTSVLGGGSGLFVYQGTTIFDPQNAPFSGGTLRIIGTIFSPISPISPISPTSPTSPASALSPAASTTAAGGPLSNPLGALTRALLASSLFNTNFTNINLLPATGVAGTTSQADATNWDAASTGLFGSGDLSQFGTLPLRLTLGQSSLLFVDGYLDLVGLDPGLVPPGTQDGQKTPASTGAVARSSVAPGSAAADSSLRLEDRLRMAIPQAQSGDAADRGERERLVVSDLSTTEAEAVFLRGEQAAQTNATNKLGVDPQPDADPINVLKLQEWLRQVVPYVQQRLQSSR